MNQILLTGLASTLSDPSVWINGLLIGGVYASMAIGFSMVWGIIGVINLTQGDIIMLGAFATWTTMNFLGTADGGGFGQFLAGLFVAMVALAIVGYVMQRWLINKVMNVSEILTLLLTFGLSLVMHQAALLYWGANPHSINVNVPGPGSYDLLGATIPSSRLLVFLLALALTGLFYVFLKQTRTGRAIRAAGQNEQAAELIGIDIDHIYAVTFAISAAIVAAVGGLIGMMFSFSPQMGVPWTLKSFVVVVIGGLGSIPGALVGGLFLGLTEHMGSSIWGAKITEAIAFTVLVLFLLVKPHGLFGEAEEGE